MAGERAAFWAGMTAEVVDRIRGRKLVAASDLAAGSTVCDVSGLVMLHEEFRAWRDAIDVMHEQGHRQRLESQSQQQQQKGQVRVRSVAAQCAHRAFQLVRILGLSLRRAQGQDCRENKVKDADGEEEKWSQTQTHEQQKQKQKQKEDELVGDLEHDNRHAAASHFDDVHRESSADLVEQIRDLWPPRHVMLEMMAANPSHTFWQEAAGAVRLLHALPCAAERLRGSIESTVIDTDTGYYSLGLDDDIELTRLLLVVQCNSHRFGFSGEHIGLFPAVARCLNHSCDPNCHVEITSHRTLALVTSRAVAAGAVECNPS
jgi:hypothetical protein